jgi:flagellar hook assembly protein FlgD
VTPPTPPPTPTAKPTPVPTSPPSPKPGIKDVSSSPEPFKRGGVYVQFSINNSVTGLKLNVFNSAGQILVSVDGGAFSAGANQVFFDGLDAKKKALPPGVYEYEIQATAGQMQESFRGRFTKASDKFR